MSPLHFHQVPCASHASEVRRKKSLSLQRPGRNTEHGTLSGHSRPPIVQEALRVTAQPLNSTTHALFEPRLGHDFSAIRVHTDRQAAADRLAESMEFGDNLIAPSAAAQSLERLRVNQPMFQRRSTSGGPPPTSLPSHLGRSKILQRKCACGGTPGPTGECEECREKRLALQTKLKVNEPGDMYEQEADRIANEVLTGSANAPISGAPPRIQRLPGPSNGQGGAVPASVNKVVASPGEQLEPAIRAFFEPRFGHDFSQVRIHTGVHAEEAARSIHAQAFTAGDHIVFAAGGYAPGMEPGRSLLAHELAHVVQQNGAAPAMPIQRQPAPGGENLALRDNITPEKWSEEIEAQYRNRGDIETANAIRACRLKGLPACKRLLTSSDVHVLYVRDIAPGSAPQRAMGAGVAAVALAPKLPPAPVGPNIALTPANENAVRTAVSEVTTGVEVSTGSTVEVGVGTAGAEVAAGATVIGAIIIVSGV